MDKSHIWLVLAIVLGYVAGVKFPQWGAKVGLSA